MENAPEPVDPWEAPAREIARRVAPPLAVVLRCCVDLTLRTLVSFPGAILLVLGVRLVQPAINVWLGALLLAVCMALGPAFQSSWKMAERIRLDRQKGKLG